MATTDESQSKDQLSKSLHLRARRDGPFRFSTDQFYQLGELGFFDDHRVELIRGTIYEMTINPGHATAMELTAAILGVIFGRGWYVRHSQPLDLGRRSQPEPDLAVVQGSIRDFSSSHPRTTPLVIEISDSTLRKDRTLKAHLYAQAGLPDYWITNLADRQLEVHRDPGPDPSRRGRFGYRDVTIVAEAGNMAPLAAPGSPVAVADLLPRP